MARTSSPTPTAGGAKPRRRRDQGTITVVEANRPHPALLREVWRSFLRDVLRQDAEAVPERVEIDTREAA